VRSRGYAFQEEILFHCRVAGCRFEETPIVFRDRRYGTSKIDWRESVAALWIIFRLGMDNLCGRRQPTINGPS
jgi:dolichol-phosphate mannosyltransferase